ncbi:hypothetical protein EV360DRAFT_85296 [Lentinula raphanica]|nr:hypothetical protein EV360DRAFT_85296 [Lentinula raphanica]
MSSTSTSGIPSQSTRTLPKPTISPPSNGAETSTHNVHTYPPTSQPSSLPSSSSVPAVSPSKMNRSLSSPSSKAAVASLASNFIVKIRRGAHTMGAHRRRGSDSSSTHSSSSSSDEENRGSPVLRSLTLTPPIVNVTGRKTRSHHSTWRCSSGPSLTTSQFPVGKQTKRVEYKDTFVCSGGVNLPLLLRATRASLVEVAERQAGISMGFGCGKKVVLDNEEWKCRITGPPLQNVSPPSSPTTSTPGLVSKSGSAFPYPSSPIRSRGFDAVSVSTSQTSVTLSPTKANKNARRFKVHIHYYACAMIVSSTSPALGRNDGNQPVALDQAREGSIRGLMTIVSRSEPDY